MWARLLRAEPPRELSIGSVSGPIGRDLARPRGRCGTSGSGRFPDWGFWQSKQEGDCQSDDLPGMTSTNNAVGQPAFAIGGGDPLGIEDYLQIAHGSRLLKGARRAERVAGWSGALMLLAGIATVPFAMGSGITMALGVVLIVLGCREISVRGGLHRLDPLACGRLARNQIALAVAISVYGVLKLMEGPGSIADVGGSAGLSQSPELAATAERIMVLVHYGVGLGLIVGAWVMQGGQALYYAKAGRSLRKAYARSPMWVMRVHAASWGGVVPEKALDQRLEEAQKGKSAASIGDLGGLSPSSGGTSHAA